MLFSLIVGPASVDIANKDENGTTTLMDGIPRQFICRTSSSNPQAIVKWKLDGQILSPDIQPLEERGEYGGIRIQSTKTIGLDKPLKSYHGRTLSCEATNSDTGQILIDSTELNIICAYVFRSIIDCIFSILVDAISLEMHGIGKDQTIKSGQLMTAHCILRGGNPPGDILWYKGNELLSSESIIESDGMSLISRVNFTASPSDDNLPLTCKGQVEHFPQKLASFTLNVLCEYLRDFFTSVDFRWDYSSTGRDDDC